LLFVLAFGFVLSWSLVKLVARTPFELGVCGCSGLVGQRWSRRK
jgi:hypothetical protein